MADVGGIINRLAPLVEKTVRTEYNLLVNSKTEATKLSFNLKEIQHVLEEAERRRLADPRVKAWFENLQDVMYEIDDALDEWDSLDLRLEILLSDEENASRNWLEKVGAFIEYLCLSSTYVFKRHDVALKIKALNEKVDSLAKEGPKYTLLPIAYDSQDVKCEITTSFSDLIPIPSQQHEKEGLVKELLTDGVQVISLVGMVGVGKTTLAQLVFNDHRVQSGFELKSWICISHISDMFRLTKAILQSLGVNYPKNAELQTLLELIQRSISRKKFFLVLDNARIEDDSIWNQLKSSLLYGHPGSRILVTSRNENVGNLIGSTKKLKPLGEEDCWSLFNRIAFSGRNEKDWENLGDIAEKIARKCEGLPLAAKTLGYYMRSRFSKQLWDDVLEKEVWQVDELAKALFTPFAVIYDEFPLALKHCFLYFSILPQNMEFNIDQITRLWTLQGYTETEIQGLDYIEKLLRNSFFQNVHRDDSSWNFSHCRMHPMFHYFARYLRKTESKNEKLRTFYSDDPLPQSELDSLKSLRVLRTKVPKEIRESLRLRYLDLSGTDIEKLPETICDLCYLKSLDLRRCQKLSELPEKIHRLRNLRHLLMAGSDLNRLPQGLEKLTNLVTLDEISVGKGKSKFRYLAKLNQLRGSLCIKIGQLNEREDVEKADLGGKIYVSELHLLFCGEVVSMEVMEALQAPPNLKSFVIKDYNHTEFPSWMGTSLNKIIKLSISHCDECLELPPVGKLPLLENLSVAHMKSLKHVGSELWRDRSDNMIFPKLKMLKFRDCASWEEWEDITEDDAKDLKIMPCLERVFLANCPKLKKLPNLLHYAESLKDLKIQESCPRLLKRRKEWEFKFQNRKLLAGTRPSGDTHTMLTSFHSILSFLFGLRCTLRVTSTECLKGIVSCLFFFFFFFFVLLVE